jgi:hypothetical protein
MERIGFVALPMACVVLSLSLFSFAPSYFRSFQWVRFVLQTLPVEVWDFMKWLPLILLISLVFQWIIRLSLLRACRRYGDVTVMIESDLFFPRPLSSS